MELIKANEIFRIGVIDFGSIFLSSIFLLFLAGYELALIVDPLLLAFMGICTVVAVGIETIMKDRLENIWGNAVSVLIAIFAVALIWTGFSDVTLLFAIMAIPSAVLAVVFWKVWKVQMQTKKEKSVTEAPKYVRGK